MFPVYLFYELMLLNTALSFSLSTVMLVRADLRQMSQDTYVLSFD